MERRWILGFAKNYLASGQVFGPFDYYTGFTDTRTDGYRDHSETNQQRYFANLGYQFSGGTTLRFDLAYVRNMQELPGSLTLAEFKQNPRQRKTPTPSPSAPTSGTITTMCATV